MCKFDGNDCLCDYYTIDNGVCDLANNKAMCDYDGGDCCDFDKIGDGLCHRLNNNPKCHNDQGDCCEGNTLNLNNNVCNEDLNNAACLYDNGDCCEGDMSLISDGICQEYNNIPPCGYDGGDCKKCQSSEFLGNGQCDSENLNYQCQFDGWDCCSNSSLIDNGVCDHESYNKVCNFDGLDCCPLPYNVGNGECDIENNIAMCNYDGGDCCITSWLGDGYCDDENNNRMCEFDHEDCCKDDSNFDWCNVCQCVTPKAIQPFDPCPLFDYIGDGICHDENNNHICIYDGGDCCGSNLDTSNCTDCHYCLEIKENSIAPYEGHCPNYASIGDGICQDDNNVPICLYDNGDCCMKDIDTSQCKECLCHSLNEFDPCLEGHKIGDGVCDLSNNNTICSFDGGDCSR